MLGTSSQDSYRIEDTDFHIDNGKLAEYFTISGRFDELSETDGGAFVEYLTWENGTPKLYVTLKARRTHRNSKRWIDVDVRTGKDGSGNRVEGAVRNFLRVTYLRALRDADRELSAGRNSRLSQILQYTDEILANRDEDFDAAQFVKEVVEGKNPAFPKNLVSVGILAEHLINTNPGIQKARARLDKSYLSNLALAPDQLSSCITVSNPTAVDVRLRQLLEKLELSLVHPKHSIDGIRRGLGYNNLLFMACELLLLGNDKDQLPLLLVEEPEAHLHPQLQLRLIDFLQAQTQDLEHQVQVIMSTHSPNLASRLSLDNLMLVADAQVFPLGREHTRLATQDYLFLERFLDVTKANLFFARGLIIIEGDAEFILLPVIAKLIGYDLSKHGISIVKAGGRGLRRYSNIFRRKDPSEKPIPIPVACLADLDLEPQWRRKTAPAESPLAQPTNASESSSPSQVAPGPSDKTAEPGDTEADSGPDIAARTPATAVDEEAIQRQALCSHDGGHIRTFVSDYKTFEYSLARCGLLQELNMARVFAQEETNLEASERMARVRERKSGKARSTVKPRPSKDELIEKAKKSLSEFRQIEKDEEKLSYLIYSSISENLKAMTAQHLATILTDSKMTVEDLKARLPKYIMEALEYVTQPIAAQAQEGEA